MLGEEHKGFDVANEWLGGTRLTVAAHCVGRAQRVIDMATEWAATRKQFGQAIGKFPGHLVQARRHGDRGRRRRVSRPRRRLEAGPRAWRADQDIAMAKLYATEMLGRVTDNAVQIFGGMGLMSELPIERFWRDARVERIWDGTSEIQRHIISRSLLRPHED